MKNSIEKLKSFANSSYNSAEEKDFMEDTMSSYYDEKLKKKYAEKLALEHGISKPTNSDEPHKPSFNWFRILIIISILMALAVAGFFLNKLNQTDANFQVADNIDAYYTEIDFNTRGELTVEEKLNDLATYYDQKDFTKIATLYKTLDLNTVDGKYLHAIAVSLVNNDQLEEAKNVWGILLETEETRFTYHNVARWFLGRAIIESGNNIEDGKAYLLEVSSNSKHYEQAQKLLSEVND